MMFNAPDPRGIVEAYRRHKAEGKVERHVEWPWQDAKDASWYARQGRRGDG